MLIILFNMNEKKNKPWLYGQKDPEKAREENSRGGKRTANYKRQKGQFKMLMEHILDNSKYSKKLPKQGGSLLNYKLLDTEPKRLKKLFKDYLSEKLETTASNNKTYKENISNRMINLLLNTDTSNMEFIKSFTLLLDILGELDKQQQTIIIDNSNKEKELDINKLKELKELLNGNKQ